MYIKKFTLRAVLLLLFMNVILLCACTASEESPTVGKDLDFTICKDENLPQELKELIDQKKKTPFKLTYCTKEYLYIAIGYGEQSMGGYSIQVENLCLAENAIYFDSNLKGPDQKEAKAGVSYPYLVAKTAYYEEPVVFQ